MTDREKVIKGLHCCVHTGGTNCAYCPYFADEDCTAIMSMDVLDLLKEQETSTLYKCPNCGTWVSAENVVRCKDCKHYRKDTCSAGAGMAFPPPDDWYCADGERDING